MKRKLQEKVKMYMMVQHTVEQNRSVWENVPKLLEAIEEFNFKLEILRKGDEQCRSYTLGVKKQRDLIKIDTINLIDEVASALRSLAVDMVDMELSAQVKYPKSTLTGASHIGLLGILDRIVYLAENHADNLKDYGVGGDKISELKLRRDTLSVEILAPRKAILKRRNEGIMLESLQKEIDHLLKIKIDGMMKPFAKTDPLFYSEFKNARKLTTVVFHNNSPEIEPPEVDDGVED